METREDLARKFKTIADRVRMTALDVLNQELESKVVGMELREQPKTVISRQDLEDLWAIGVVLSGIREGRL